MSRLPSIQILIFPFFNGNWLSLTMAAGMCITPVDPRLVVPNLLVPSFVILGIILGRAINIVFSTWASVLRIIIRYNTKQKALYNAWYLVFYRVSEVGTATLKQELEKKMLETIAARDKVGDKAFNESRLLTPEEWAEMARLQARYDNYAKILNKFCIPASEPLDEEWLEGVLY